MTGDGIVLFPIISRDDSDDNVVQAAIAEYKANCGDYRDASVDSSCTSSDIMQAQYQYNIYQAVAQELIPSIYAATGWMIPAGFQPTTATVPVPDWKSNETGKQKWSTVYKRMLDSNVCHQECAMMKLLFQGQSFHRLGRGAIASRWAKAMNAIDFSTAFNTQAGNLVNEIATATRAMFRRAISQGCWYCPVSTPTSFGSGALRFGNVGAKTSCIKCHLERSYGALATQELPAGTVVTTLSIGVQGAPVSASIENIDHYTNKEEAAEVTKELTSATATKLHHDITPESAVNNNEWKRYLGVIRPVELPGPEGEATPSSHRSDSANPDRLEEGTNLSCTVVVDRLSVFPVAPVFSSLAFLVPGCSFFLVLVYFFSNVCQSTNSPSCQSCQSKL